MKSNLECYATLDDGGFQFSQAIGVGKTPTDVSDWVAAISLFQQKKKIIWKQQINKSILGRTKKKINPITKLKKKKSIILFHFWAHKLVTWHCYSGSLRTVYRHNGWSAGAKTLCWWSWRSKFPSVCSVVHLFSLDRSECGREREEEGVGGITHSAGAADVRSTGSNRFINLRPKRLCH